MFSGWCNAVCKQHWQELTLSHTIVYPSRFISFKIGVEKLEETIDNISGLGSTGTLESVSSVVSTSGAGTRFQEVV